jgi:hypothetical protein
MAPRPACCPVSLCLAVQRGLRQGTSLHVPCHGGDRPLRTLCFWCLSSDRLVTVLSRSLSSSIPVMSGAELGTQVGVLVDSKPAR